MANGVNHHHNNNQMNGNNGGLNSNPLASFEELIKSFRLTISSNPALQSNSADLLSQFDTSAAELSSLINSLQDNFNAASQRESELYAQLQEIKGGNVRVFARIRSLLPKEIQSGESSDVLDIPNLQQVAFQSSPGAAVDHFTFDHVFPGGATQAECYSHVEELILPVLSGHRAAIFAYGQTGSGKTFTMIGKMSDPEQRGIFSRSLTTLFDGIAKRRPLFNYEVRMSVIEIYNETLVDLLNPSAVDSSTTDEKDSKNSTGVKLAIREGPRGFYVHGSVSKLINSLDESMSVLEFAFNGRRVAANDINSESSRSHLIVMIDVQGLNTATQLTVSGKLYLTDLAGSERQKSSGSSGQRLTEASHINKSLSALNDVLLALTNPKTRSHTPFRNSKLTYLLQDSFKGNSKTLMWVTLSPNHSHASETMCSLQFAVRARSVQLGSSQASADSGWVNKYKSLLETAQKELIEKEKAFKLKTTQLEEKVKSKEEKAEKSSSEVRVLSEKIREVEKLLEEERGRDKSKIAYLASSKGEEEASRRMRFMQLELDQLNGKLSLAKTQIERQQDDTKEKLSAANKSISDKTAQIKSLEIELQQLVREQRGTVAAVRGADEESAESVIARLQKEKALMELEMKRLKMAQRAANKPASGIVRPSSLNVAAASTAPISKSKPSSSHNSPKNGAPEPPTQSRRLSLGTAAATKLSALAAPKKSFLPPPSVVVSKLRAPSNATAIPVAAPSPSSAAASSSASAIPTPSTPTAAVSRLRQPGAKK